MQTHSPKEITRLLAAWSDGDQSALDKLVPLVQSELTRLAHHYMGRERPGHTLQTSALVNEAYIRLIDWKNVRWQNRAHFFAVSAQLMRRILVDFARERNYLKRGGGALQVSLSEAAALAMDKEADLVALDEALVELSEMDRRRPGGGTTILWWPVGEGNGRSAKGLGRNGDARLATSKGMASATAGAGGPS